MKKILIVILLFVSSGLFAQAYFYGQNQSYGDPPVGTYPAYVDNGGIAFTGGATVAVPFPATVNRDDILIVQLLDADADTFITPLGWGLIYSDSENRNASVAFYWLRATGSESGTVNFTSGTDDGNGYWGLMSRYSGCTTNDPPYEDATGEAVTQNTTPDVPAMTSTSGYRLAVGLACVEDDALVSSYPSNYTSAFSISDRGGSDARMMGCWQEILSAGAVGVENWVLQTNEYHGTVGFLLLPE